jgi:hypothetical protein
MLSRNMPHFGKASSLGFHFVVHIEDEISEDIVLIGHAVA